AGRARVACRRGAASGPFTRALRGWDRRLHSGGAGLRDRRGTLLSGTLGGRGAGVRGTVDVPLRAGVIGLPGDTAGRRGAAGDPVGGRCDDLRRARAGPPAGPGPRVAPRAGSRRADGRLREEPARGRARGARPGEGGHRGPRLPQKGRRYGCPHPRPRLPGLRLGRQPHRPCELRGPRLAVLHQVPVARNHPSGSQRRQQASAGGRPEHSTGV
ncbi:MAG: Endonuclease V, partial [uncultured Rubrobacteraceae bacterium]